ncbi:MAG: indolepyruvate oxidoreductase subunit beta [Desulfitobacteriaceae bacterium]|nr:indolepyruvate oxidoreductase subunit beta [Desulfitobacteriaceae bacterium]MDI6878985.1 indolepyruvate oxidoreductase subunit beta [Desulfitobacteriaceae bacterium]MDI6916144.1 indolepyruvate oxidoreductase subunit beta [Desulfitobacteriaceae bacterium]
MKLDIVIAGVGGQGSVLASRVIAQAAMAAGWEVRTTETIGMAQREGSVVSHVRIGSQLYGALVPDQQADILFGLELAETARALMKLKPGGVIIANQGKVVPASVSLGLSHYAEEPIRESLYQKTKRVMLVDADALAMEAGNSKTVNVVLLGVLSALAGLPFRRDDLLQVILESVPKKAVAMNQEAFERGRKIGVTFHDRK